jgi:CHAT domain-containing protein
MDNIHGLAAAFLRAGAGAVIGALWPFTPEVADTSFVALYAALAAGTDTVDAFRLAQLCAREEPPEYRDWGAFTFLGANLDVHNGRAVIFNWDR